MPSTRKCIAARSRTRTISGARWPAASTGSSRSPRSRTPRTTPRTSRSNGSRTARSTSAANCVDRHLKDRADQIAIIWEGDDPTNDEHITYRELHERVSQVRQCALKQWRQEGRPRHDLPADDPGSRLRHAGLRAHRRRPFRRVRRLLARQPRRPHRGLPSRSSSSPPTRACAAAAPSRSRRTPTTPGHLAQRGATTVRRSAGGAPHRRRGRRGRPAATSGSTRNLSSVSPTARPTR